MAKIISDETLSRALLTGCDRLSRIVSSNFGPKGRNTICDQKYDLPMVVNTGRLTLQDFHLDDPFEDMGASIVRDAAMKIASEYGDGAITCALLSKDLVHSGFWLIASGYHPVKFRRSLLRLMPVIRQWIEKTVRPCDPQRMARYLVASAKHPEAAEVVAQAMEQVGADGIITVLDSQRKETEVTCFDGIRYDTGMLSSAFTAGKVDKTIHLDHPYVLLSNVKIRSLKEIEGILYEVIRQDASLLIICSDMDEYLQGLLASNVADGRIKLAVAKAPGHGENRRRNMFSLAAKTGSLLIDENRGIELEKCGLEICAQIGSCEVDKENTMLRGFPGESIDMVTMLTRHTQKALAEEKKDYAKEELGITLSILKGKSAQIQVGAASEYEMFEKKYLYENLVRSAQVGAKRGFVPGGANLYAKLSAFLRQESEAMEETDQAAARCLADALQGLLRTAAYNAGITEHNFYQAVFSDEDPYHGFDILTGDMTDLDEAGILMPADSAMAIIETAVETATSLWTTSAAISYQ